MPTRSLSTLAGCAFLLGACSSMPAIDRDTATSTPRAGSDAAWERLDPDQDGFLTVAELESQRGVALLRDLWRTDTDHDRRVSRQEWDLWWPRMTRTPPSPSMQALNGNASAPETR